MAPIPPPEKTKALRAQRSVELAKSLILDMAEYGEDEEDAFRGHYLFTDADLEKFVGGGGSSLTQDEKRLAKDIKTLVLEADLSEWVVDEDGRQGIRLTANGLSSAQKIVEVGEEQFSFQDSVPALRLITDHERHTQAIAIVDSLLQELREKIDTNAIDDPSAIDLIEQVVMVDLADIRQLLTSEIPDDATRWRLLAQAYGLATSAMRILQTVGGGLKNKAGDTASIVKTIGALAKALDSLKDLLH